MPRKIIASLVGIAVAVMTVVLMEWLAAKVAPKIKLPGVPNE
jgi:hypothetical protein